ncbi:MAG TPA: tetratricopeptide repeat protein, partial [Bacteroidia bacterium]|nr:tetratricopeptide repeat protein [Bacteroidia bacterium]
MIRINNLISSFFVSLILLSSYNSIAVDNKMDSLRTALSKSREDTNKVKTLNTISWELSYTDLDSANQYCYQALELSKKINWARGTGASYHQIAWVNYQKGDYFKSLEFNQRALAIWDSMLHHGGAGVLSQVKNSKLKTLNNCGLVYWNIGDYPKAINNFFDALKIEEEISNTQMEANTLNNIGLIYLEQGDNPKAMDYFTQALRLAQKQGYKLLEANTLSNIGTIYYKQGEKNVSAKNSSGSTKEFTAALENFLKSIHIREEIGDDQGKAMDLGNVGSVYFSLHDYPNAIEYDKQTLKLAEEFGDKQLQSNTLENLGSLYTTLNDYRLGEKYLLEGLKLSDSIGDLQGRAEINQYLSELYSRMGNYRKSLESYKAAEIAKDSLFNMNKANEITRKEMNFEFDKKEAKAKAEQEQKEALAKKEIQRQKFIRNTFISGFIIVLLFAFVFFKQRNKIKLGKKHSDELLLNILPAEVAEELKAKGSAEAKQFNEVTVMFTDFKNFTSISEKLSP